MNGIKKGDKIQVVKEIDNLIVKARVGATGYVKYVLDDDSYVISIGMWELGCKGYQIKPIE